MSERHCKECGSTAPGENIPNPGSDVIPHWKCPDCGTVYCIKCDCDNPESHA